MKGAGEADFSALLEEFALSVEASQSALLDEIREAIEGLKARVSAVEAAERQSQSALAERLDRLEAQSAPPPPEENAEPAPSPAVRELRLRHSEIWELHQAGADPAIIARRLGRPAGEIRLLVHLMDPRERSSREEMD